jgi:adenylate cyclase
MSGLTAEGLAAKAGTTPAQVERFVALGLLERRSDEAPFDERDIHRVRFAEAIDAAGISLEDVAQLVAAGRYSLVYIEDVFPRPGAPLLDTTFADLADDHRLPWEAVREMYTNWGLATPDRGQRPRADDDEVLRGRAEVRDLGHLDEEALVASSRFLGENIRRLAVSQVGFFREYVMDVLRARLPRRQMMEAIGPLAVRMRASSEHLRNWLYDRHLEALTFQTAIEELELVLAEAGHPQARAQRCPAIAFLDLGGYTRMTQEAGDQAAVELAARLVALVRRAAGQFRGEVVKLLGDGVMFHFRDPGDAVACSLHLVVAAESEGLPPARAGLHAGTLVFRDGDYFGQTVNLASRIADYARPREVLVSETVAQLAEASARFEPIGEIGLKGLADPVSLYRARNRDSSPAG